MNFKLREKQQQVYDYTGGTMAVSAVPGSGKTFTLSALAAKLVEQLLAEGNVDAETGTEREVLIVTFSNAAAANFAARIGAILADNGLIPGVGYKVCTLHSMALEIIRGHTQQLGIADDFEVLDDLSADAILNEAVRLWQEDDIRDTFDAIVEPGMTPEAQDKKYKENWTENIRKLCKNVISQAKDYHITPEELRERLDRVNDPFAKTLLTAVCNVYAQYQSRLRNYPAVDFADLMFYAHRLLSTDPGYLAHLQIRWPYILEDEAQDSSLIQEEVLKMLTARSGNWVRVGDPNQAINETFTTADPKYLRNFMHTAKTSVTMDAAGRSARSILVQANHLVNWVVNEHPNTLCRDAFSPTYVRMTAKDDSQKNPTDDPSRVHYDPRLYSTDNEIGVICTAACQHAAEHPSETIVILVPGNDFGKQFVDRLANYPVEVIEVLRSTRKARAAADVITKVLEWISMPLHNERMLSLFDFIYNESAKGEFFIDSEDSKRIKDLLSKFRHPEEFFYPAQTALLNDLPELKDTDEFLLQILMRFRGLLRRWLDARFLPYDQLVLLIAQDLFTNPDDLCTASLLGGLLARTARLNPTMNLDSAAAEIKKAVKEGSLSFGMGSDTQFNPNSYPGKIVVTTFHKSKGLEWDQVYLTSCNNFDFPNGSPQEYSRHSAVPGYVREKLNLQAEALQALKTVAFPDEYPVYNCGDGTKQAWLNNVRERLRLLYVGITRAKKGLHISFSNGCYQSQTEPTSIRYLREVWENRPHKETPC